jgi:hypothetical protein
MERVNITIGPVTFEYSDYAAKPDVLHEWAILGSNQ